MTRAVAGLAAASVLFAAGFVFAGRVLTVSIDTVSIGSTDASFAYGANQAADFYCSLTGPAEPCGTSTTAGSTTYAVGPGAYTFGVEARWTVPGKLTTAASTSATFAIAAPADTTASVTTTTVVVTTTVPATVGTATTVTVGGDASPAPWIAATAGFAAVAAAAAGWLTMRWRRRSGWQAKATTEEPPSQCVPPGRWCTTEVELKPGRRDIAYLSLPGQGPAAHDLTGRSEGGAAEALNDAVHAYRRGSAADEVRLVVMPAAAELLDELRVRAVDGTDGVVAIAAHLEGGKASCTFTVYRCVGTPPTTEWKKRDSWTVEVDDERDEPVAQLKLPLDERSLELLVAQLAGFVAKVDVPEKS